MDRSKLCVPADPLVLQRSSDIGPFAEKSLMDLSGHDEVGVKQRERHQASSLAHATPCRDRPPRLDLGSQEPTRVIVPWSKDVCPPSRISGCRWQSL